MSLWILGCQLLWIPKIPSFLSSFFPTLNGCLVETWESSMIGCWWDSLYCGCLSLANLIVGRARRINIYDFLSCLGDGNLWLSLEFCLRKTLNGWSLVARANALIVYDISFNPLLSWIIIWLLYWIPFHLMISR